MQLHACSSCARSAVVLFLCAGRLRGLFFRPRRAACAVFRPVRYRFLPLLVPLFFLLRLFPCQRPLHNLRVDQRIDKGIVCRERALKRAGIQRIHLVPRHPLVKAIDLLKLLFKLRAQRLIRPEHAGMALPFLDQDNHMTDLLIGAFPGQPPGKARGEQAYSKRSAHAEGGP